MTATILSIETEVPSTFLSQEQFAEIASKHLNLLTPQARFLARIAKNSQINHRHTIIEDFFESGLRGSVFCYGEDNPKTAIRNEIFKKYAPLLAESVCDKALKQWGGDRQDITHVISVSCTGMIAPGIEFLLIDLLGLPQHVERLGINFMGCFGAFKGLAIAKALAMENPKHRILLVCTELCSLHFQSDINKDTLIANSIFADGAAAVVVGSSPNITETPLLEIHKQASMAIKDTKDLMTWECGDSGYLMRLSALVPSKIEMNVAPFISRLIGKENSFESYTWAVHPGGKSILEAVTRACNLEPEQLKPSWKILESYGNMSSPTFLFVLKEILKKSKAKEEIIGLGIGPGLSVEGILLKHPDSYVAK
ncbi:MAG: type III polyketide synthase [Parachlamydiaceae bacterium]